MWYPSVVYWLRLKYTNKRNLMIYSTKSLRLVVMSYKLYLFIFSHNKNVLEVLNWIFERRIMETWFQDHLTQPTVTCRNWNWIESHLMNQSFSFCYQINLLLNFFTLFDQKTNVLWTTFLESNSLKVRQNYSSVSYSCYVKHTKNKFTLNHTDIAKNILV
jgi:hypothetical protein